MKKYKRPKGITLSQIFNKTGGKCSYCGRELDAFTFQVDHVIPQSRGGLSDISNLVPACEACNRKKRDRTLEEFKEWIPKAIAQQARKLSNMLDWAEAFYRTHSDMKSDIDMLARTYENGPSREIVFFIEGVKS